MQGGTVSGLPEMGGGSSQARTGAGRGGGGNAWGAAGSPRRVASRSVRRATGPRTTAPRPVSALSVAVHTFPPSTELSGADAVGPQASAPLCPVGQMVWEHFSVSHPTACPTLSRTAQGRSRSVWQDVTGRTHGGCRSERGTQGRASRPAHALRRPTVTRGAQVMAHSHTQQTHRREENTSRCA